MASWAQGGGEDLPGKAIHGNPALWIHRRGKACQAPGQWIPAFLLSTP